jgi:hypothetical protein
VAGFFLAGWRGRDRSYDSPQFSALRRDMLGLMREESGLAAMAAAGV